MARLSAHLKYYVTKRISEDAEWRNVKVILSGHDVSLLERCGIPGLIVGRCRERASTRYKNTSGCRKHNRTSAETDIL
jgi:hypothetical protein